MIVTIPGQPPGIICEEITHISGSPKEYYAFRDGHIVLIGKITFADMMRMPLTSRPGDIEIDWSGVVAALDALDEQRNSHENPV